MRVKQRLMNSRTTIFLKVKIELNADISAAQKKYPLYRLAINPLELLDRKHCEMHPSWLSFAVKLTAFFGYFLLL